MAVKIRMTRTGANKDISYRIVATDSRCPRDGKHLEVIGWYNPKKTGMNFELKMERIEFWQSKGAQLSDTVKSLVKKTHRAARAKTSA